MMKDINMKETTKEEVKFLISEAFSLQKELNLINEQKLNYDGKAAKPISAVHCPPGQDCKGFLEKSPEPGPGGGGDPDAPGIDDRKKAIADKRQKKAEDDLKRIKKNAEDARKTANKKGATARQKKLAKALEQIYKEEAAKMEKTDAKAAAAEAKKKAEEEAKKKAEEEAKKKAEEEAKKKTEAEAKKKAEEKAAGTSTASDDKSFSGKIKFNWNHIGQEVFFKDNAGDLIVSIKVNPDFEDHDQFFAHIMHEIYFADEKKNHALLTHLVSKFKGFFVGAAKVKGPPIPKYSEEGGTKEKVAYLMYYLLSGRLVVYTDISFLKFAKDGVYDKGSIKPRRAPRSWKEAITLDKTMEVYSPPVDDDCNPAAPGSVCADELNPQ
jgi:hypothetical protein